MMGCRNRCSMWVVMVVVLSVVMTPRSRAQGPPFPMTPAGGQGPMPIGGNGYPQVHSSHCRYLINAPSPWGVNASPFKLYTRSYAGEVRRGYPIEVSILPFYEAFKVFNFTDFALWAEPLTPRAAATPQGEMQWGGGAAQPPPSAPSVTHLGVWQVFPQYAGGAGSMKCNIYSRGEDTVGSFEERMLELLQTRFPMDNRLAAFAPSARHGAAFLWYPDEKAMTTSSVKFIAKLKSFGQWFTLESTPWRVHRPPPRRQFNFNNFIDTYSNLAGQARSMERQLDQVNAP